MKAVALRRAARLVALAGLVSAAVATRAADMPAATRTLAVCADPSNLPYSNDRGEGFENRIAGVLAQELHATLRYTWQAQRRGFLRRTLQSGACDLVVGVPDALPGVLHSRPYYASSYVFVTARRSALALQGFDDPALRGLRIGLQALGAEGANTPPASALARRGLADQVTGFSVLGEEADESPQAHIVEAVARGAIDVAVIWGPLAGYYAPRQEVALDVTPVESDPQQPALAFRYAMSLGVRRGDTAFLNELQQALDRRQQDIRAILRDYGVPLVGDASILGD